LTLSKWHSFIRSQSATFSFRPDQCAKDEGRDKARERVDTDVHEGRSAHGDQRVCSQTAAALSVLTSCITGFVERCERDYRNIGASAS